jgi:hypothetical protein
MELTIHGDLYTINFVSKSNGKLIDPEDGRIHWGITRFEEKGIYIRNDLDKPTIKKVLIHELVHAFADSYGFGQVEWTEEIVADFFEQYLQDISSCVQDVLREYFCETTRNN